MKITMQKLRQIVKEEVKQDMLNEDTMPNVSVAQTHRPTHAGRSGERYAFISKEGRVQFFDNNEAVASGYLSQHWEGTWTGTLWFEMKEFIDDSAGQTREDFIAAGMLDSGYIMDSVHLDKIYYAPNFELMNKHGHSLNEARTATGDEDEPEIIDL